MVAVVVQAALLSNGAYIYVRTESDDDLGSATLVGVNAVGLVRRATPAAWPLLPLEKFNSSY